MIARREILLTFLWSFNFYPSLIAFSWIDWLLFDNYQFQDRSRQIRKVPLVLVGDAMLDRYLIVLNVVV